MHIERAKERPRGLGLMRVQRCKSYTLPYDLKTLAGHIIPLSVQKRGGSLINVDLLEYGHIL